ncbi:MAG: AAA family ATPase [Bacteroidia bacterium]|nr:AAA family ATPase [Bacteroidia bacterium]
MHLSLANPHTDNPMLGSGIVLIDEIDLHLHPKWQRKVVFKLLETFPNVQFVMTSHSPLLISMLDKKLIRIIKNGKICESSYTKGRDTNAILSDNFEVSERPEEYRQKISKFYDLLEQNVESAREVLDELKQDLGESDPEIVRAESYLEIY